MRRPDQPIDQIPEKKKQDQTGYRNLKSRPRHSKERLARLIHNSREEQGAAVQTRNLNHSPTSRSLPFTIGDKPLLQGNKAGKLRGGSLLKGGKNKGESEKGVKSKRWRGLRQGKRVSKIEEESTKTRT